jgi:hypothetical protein
MSYPRRDPGPAMLSFLDGGWVRAPKDSAMLRRLGLWSM